VTADELAAMVDEAVPGGLEAHEEGIDMPTLTARTAALREVCRALRDRAGFNLLSDVVPVDYLGYGEEVAGYFGSERGRDINRTGSWGSPVVAEAPPKRFGVKYHLAHVEVAAETQHGIPRVRVQVFCDDGEPVPSVVAIWPTADWHEREAYDFMGIAFEGHPNLRRLIMPSDWAGHPLRKDYPIGGEPVQFTDAV
jgi:NADH:ubiquinone oxidoreductase subunit C